MLDEYIPTFEEIEEQERQAEARNTALIQQAARTLHNNQECYVAQWILHNQDKNFNDYMLVNEWNNGGGYNFYMVRKDDIRYAREDGQPRP